jgi:transposase-like protein
LATAPKLKNKLTPKLIEKLGIAFELGLKSADAAAYAGCTEATYYRWMAQARNGAGDPRLQLLLKVVGEAKARNVEKNLVLVQEAAMNGSWQAAAWILERRHGWRKDGPIEEVPDELAEISSDLTTLEGRRQVVKALRELPPELLHEAMEEEAS